MTASPAQAVDARLRALGGRVGRGAAVGAALLGAAALVLHRAWLGEGHGVAVQALAALVLVPLFALAGAVAGGGLVITSTLRRILPEVERRVDVVVGHVVSRLAEAARAGRGAKDAGARVIDAETRGLAVREPAGETGSALGALVWRWLIALARRRLTREAAASLGRRGLERLARETVVGLVIGDVRWRVNLAHAVLLAMCAVALAGPVAWLLLRAAA